MLGSGDQGFRKVDLDLVKAARARRMAHQAQIDSLERLPFDLVSLRTNQARAGADRGCLPAVFTTLGRCGASQLASHGIWYPLPRSLTDVAHRYRLGFTAGFHLLLTVVTSDMLLVLQLGKYADGTDDAAAALPNLCLKPHLVSPPLHY